MASSPRAWAGLVRTSVFCQRVCFQTDGGGGQRSGLRVTTCSRRDLPLLPPFLPANFLQFADLEDDGRSLASTAAHVYVHACDLEAWTVPRLRAVHTGTRHCRGSELLLEPESARFLSGTFKGLKEAESSFFSISFHFFLPQMSSEQFHPAH